MKRWVVRSGDGVTVAAILTRAKEAEAAVAEGRVFVGKRRVVSGAELVKVGDEVRIGAPAPKREALVVLWEKRGLVAVDKPAGLPTVPDHDGASHSLVALVAARAGCAIGDVRVTSRLDREVSGVVVFALDAAAEARLKTARERGLYTRRYVAIAEAAPAAGPWEWPIGRGKDPRHRAVDGPEAKEAHTRWQLVGRAGTFALLAVEPQTGRTHQIRVHSAHAGAPLFGDRDYGGHARVTLANGAVAALPRIALHAAQVTVPDEDDTPLAASAAVPPALRQAWTALGGAPEAWDTAITCSLDS